MDKDTEREGFYEKMWKDFVSFQRGDATLICKDAARYRWLRDVGQDTVEVFFATDNNSSGWGCWDSWADKDAGIDAAMLKTPNV
jgi:hypothetical protein